MLLGIVLYQTLLFLVIWDVYLRLGGKNASFIKRSLFLILDVFLCSLEQLIHEQYGLTFPILPFLTVGMSFYLNRTASSAERFFLGFYPVVVVDLARRFLSTFAFPPLLGVSATTLTNTGWWSLIPLAFVLPTIHFVDFVLRLDFRDILRVAQQQVKQSRLRLMNMVLLIYYSLFYLVTTFDLVFPELHLESSLRLPMVLGYLYLLLFILGSVNQFAKEKMAQDLDEEQIKHLNHLKKENERMERLYKDMMTIRSNYNHLLDNLREVEFTGDIRTSKKDLVDLYINPLQKTSIDDVAVLKQIQNMTIRNLLSSKYHEAQMYDITIYLEVPDPIRHTYLTDLDLAVVLSYLMDMAIESVRPDPKGFISIAYFEEEGKQSFIIENTVVHPKNRFFGQASTETTFQALLDSKRIPIIQDVLKRYPKTTFSTKSRHHKLMHILEMRP